MRGRGAGVFFRLIGGYLGLVPFYLRTFILKLFCANFYLEAFLCRAKRGSVKNEKRIIPSGVGVAGGVRFASGEQVSL